MRQGKNTSRSCLQSQSNHPSRPPARRGGLFDTNKKEPANMPSKNITQPEDWWDAFQYEADAAGLSLSAWIGECCLNQIRSQTKGHSKVKKLSDRPLASRPPKNGGAK